MCKVIESVVIADVGVSEVSGGSLEVGLKGLG
jgi:hypothetical protein